MNMTASETGKKLSSKTEQMIRVDHAGEHGAVSIYRGQLAVFGNTDQKAEIAELVKHMAEQEQSHMDSFDKLILEKNIRPTVLAPLWDAAGFTLGAVTALMGEKAAMACTAAVGPCIAWSRAESLACGAATCTVSRRSWWFQTTTWSAGNCRRMSCCSCRRGALACCGPTITCR